MKSSHEPTSGLNDMPSDALKANGRAGLQADALIGIASVTGVTCLAPDPIGVIEEEHALHRELCDLLESLADGLPAQIDRTLAYIAVTLLETSMPQHIQLEEQALFPLLRARARQHEALVPILHCLEHEHETDLSFGGELSDTLRAIADGQPPANPEMLGYMLRGYFESQRRHLEWEDRVVLPAARAILTAEDLLELQDWIMQSDRPRCIRQSVMTVRAARSAAALCNSCQCAGSPTGGSNGAQ